MPAVDGSNLSSVNAALLDGQAANFYQNAGNLNSGTLNDARLSTNVALLNGANSFTNTNTFTGNLSVQGTINGQAAVFSNNVAALSFTQNGNVVCDNSGNCSGSTGVTGGGTTNTLALFTSSGVIGDSIITQSGATIDVAGTLQATALQGDGSAITNVNASQLNSQSASFYQNATNLTAGTVSSSRLPATVVYSDTNTNFTATLQHNGNAVCDASNNCDNVSSSTFATAFAQNGNAFATIAILGTTDNFALVLQTNGTERLRVNATGGISVTGNLAASGTISAASLSGNGAGVTNVNAATLGGQASSYYTDAGNLSSGTINDLRLGTNVTLQGNTFNGINQLVKLTGTGALPVLDGAALIAVNAALLNGQAAGYYTNASNLNTGTVSVNRLPGTVAYTDTSNTFTANNNFTGGLQRNGNTVCDTGGNCNAAGAAGGDLTGSYPNPTIAKLQGTTVTVSSLANGDVLQYNGSAFVNGHIANNNLAAGSFANITGVGTLGSLTVSGVSSLRGGATLGVASTSTGVLTLANIASSFTGGLQVASLTQNTIYTLPASTASTDTICLVTLNNCSGSGAGSIGALDTGGAANANGATIASNTLYLQSASITNPGLVNIGLQSFTGAKTFTSTLTVTGATALNGGLTVASATATQDQILITVAAVGAARFNGVITNADLTAARTYTLPNETGTICTNAAGGACSALSFYIQNSPALQTGNFNITGTGMASTSLNTPLLTTNSGGLTISPAAGSGILMKGTSVTMGTVGAGGTQLVVNGFIGGDNPSVGGTGYDAPSAMNVVGGWGGNGMAYGGTGGSISLTGGGGGYDGLGGWLGGQGGDGGSIYLSGGAGAVGDSTNGANGSIYLSGTSISLSGSVIASGLFVAGATTLNTTLVVTGSATLSSFLTVNGASTFNNTATVHTNTNSATAFRIQNNSSVNLFTADTTAAKLIIGVSGGDTTGALLVLGTKTTAGDFGAPVSGGMYYNSSLGKFRCYENAAWKNCLNGIAYNFSTVAGATAATAAKAAADTIQITPIYVAGQITVNEMRANITTTLGAAGDIGIYNSAGTLVLNGGSSTVTTAAPGIQAIAPVQTGAARILEPGQYYVAITWNSTTGAIAGANITTAGSVKRTGNIAGGGLVLPGSLTLSTITDDIYLYGFSLNN